MNEVETFIERFKAKYPKALEDTFLNGYCYWFALMLAKRFKGDIWFNQYICHFATYIGGYLYDISGMLEDTYGWCSWESFQLSHHYEAVQIERNVIRKEEKPSENT